MLDIVEVADGKDMGFADSIVTKAGNILSVQIGSLEYQPDFGVDLRYFLNSNLQFQNESFRAYLIERLSFYQVNVADVFEVLSNLMSQYIFSVGDATERVEGLIR